ncbi:MAG: hypothetical protein PUE04_07865 [Lachnospira sp.]|nr:hypothetical protein [Lachnospira sp.]
MSEKNVEKEIDAILEKMSDDDRKKLIGFSDFSDTYALLKTYGLNATQKEAEEALQSIVNDSENIGTEFFDAIGAEVKKIFH